MSIVQTRAVPGGPEPARAAAEEDARPAASSRWGLGWRVFAGNAAVLLGVSAFLLLTPATISSPVVISEALVLVAAVSVSLLLNLLLIERALAPMDELRRLMRRVDPLDPGRRVVLPGADADVAALADAFNGMLDRLETERRESARRALTAQEDERRRLARELHDELGQVLTGVLLLMDEASKAPAPRALEALEEGREAARASIDEVRRIVRDLRPEALDDLGLSSAVNLLAAQFERQSGVRLERRIPPGLDGLGPDEELVVYRVIQEALTNVARHAEATTAWLEIEPDAHGLHVEVRDDGRGLGSRPHPDGGMRGMRERALLVGGSLAVGSSPGAGTRVALDVPLDRR